MPAGKIIPFEPGEYASLDNLSEGAKVSFSGQGTIVKGGLQIDAMDFENDENEATRELKSMTGNEYSQPAPKKSNGF